MRKRAPAWGSCLLIAALAAGFLGGESASAVAGADEVAGGELPFAAKVNFSDASSCSGALVAPQWIVTAKDCFANGDVPVTTGAPSKPSTVVVGRTDLATAAGKRLMITTLVPHPDRNIVLAQLSAAVRDVNPVPIATSAAAAGDAVRIAGYGRTADRWVPNRLHAGAFTVQSATETTFEVAGASPGATLCKGDSGGPALREVSSVLELVGITDSTWGKGCIGEPASETRGEGYQTRVDDLADWVSANTSTRPTDLRQVVAGEFTRDGFPDLFGIDSRGWGWFYRGTSASTWAPPTRQSATWGTYKELIVGRVDRDAYDDLLVLDDTGQLFLYPGAAAGGLSPRKVVNTGFTGYRDLTLGRLQGDTYDALYAIESSGAWYKFSQTSAGGAFSTTRTQMGAGWNCCKQNTFGKFNNDAYLDLLTVDSATGKLRLYPGTATGALGTFTTLDGAGTGWNDVSYLAAGKFDGTGLDGLLAIDAATAAMSVHRRTAGGGWADKTAPVGTPWVRQPFDMARLAGGEFTRDGFHDLVGIDSDGWSWLFPGTAANTWGSPVRLSDNWSTYKELVVGRVDRDAYDDVVVLNESGQLVLFAGNASGLLTPKGIIGSGYNGYRDLTLGKLNGDTYDALYAIENATGLWFKFAQTAAGGAFSTTRTQVGAGWVCCKQNTFGHFNQDAYLDLFTVESATGKARVYAGTATGALSAFTTIDAAGSAWANRDVAISRPSVTGRDGVLAKDPSGALLLFRSSPIGGEIQWTDPITYGPRG